MKKKEIFSLMLALGLLASTNAMAQDAGSTTPPAPGEPMLTSMPTPKPMDKVREAREGVRGARENMHKEMKVLESTFMPISGY